MQHKSINSKREILDRIAHTMTEVGGLANKARNVIDMVRNSSTSQINQSETQDLTDNIELTETNNLLSQHNESLTTFLKRNKTPKPQFKVQNRNIVEHKRHVIMLTTNITLIHTTVY